MSYAPRWYQQESVDHTLSYYFEQGGQENALICLPTGSGKSFTLCQFTKEVIERVPSARIMVLTHVKELIKQNHKSMKKFWPRSPAGIYSAGLKLKQSNFQITFGGIGSVAKKPELFGFVNILIVDECHLIGDKDNSQYISFIHALREVNPSLKVVGLTATPFRLNMGSILTGGIFGHIAYNGCTMQRFNRMIHDGFLSPLVPRDAGRSLGIDVSKIRTRGNEFVHADADAAMNNEEVTRHACVAIAEEFKARKHLMVFAQSVDHCGEIVRELSQHGIDCVQVHSKMPSKDRDKNIADFTAGNVPALVNMGVLTTGFDFPALDMIAVLRLTQSAALWVQILGRGCRVHPDKLNCLVLDFAGNTKRLGCINDPVIPRAKGMAGGGVAPVKECPECEAMIHASARECPHCQYEFPKGCSLEMEAGSGELVRGLVTVPPTRHAVDAVTFTRHTKKGKQDSLKVSYRCGMTFFNEWVSVEATSAYAQSKAQEWIKKRLPWADRLPTTIADCVEYQSSFKTPSALFIDDSGKYAEIKDYEWGEPARDDDPF